MSKNFVILIGRLGKDPELKTTASGQAVCTFSLATSEKFKDKSGSRQEKTAWHNIVVWSKSAEFASKYLCKGTEVCIDGRIEYREWTDKEGNKRNTTDIVCNNITLLGSKKDNVQSVTAEQSNKSYADEDLPF